MTEHGDPGERATVYWEEIRQRQERQKKAVALAVLAVIVLIALVSIVWLLPHGPS